MTIVGFIDVDLGGSQAGRHSTFWVLYYDEREPTLEKIKSKKY